MKVLLLNALIPAAATFPAIAKLYERQSVPALPLPLSQNEGNSGPIDSLTFDPNDQYVDVSPGSQHEFQSPGPNDKRGLCPGLNAAANHGFLDRSGITTIPETITGLGQAYGLGPAFAGFLAAFSVALTGDPTGGTWSVGGSYTPTVLGTLLSDPEGIDNSHNTYEDDASPGRGDAYLNGGDDVSLEIARFDDIYNRSPSLTLDNLRDHNKQVHDFSIQNNPYFFQAPFGGLVPIIAHQFIINLMSNHSADNPNGFLTGDVFKSFFAVTGDDGAHVWNRGQEQIPQNWYRRPSTNNYEVDAALADVVILATKYPDVVAVGGNTGTTNSFVGVDPGDLTGGVFNAQNLLQGNNLGCFAFQAAQQGLPGVLKGRLSDIAPAIALVNQNLSPILSSLNCPALSTFDDSSLQQFPGAGYTPALQQRKRI